MGRILALLGETETRSVRNAEQAEIQISNK